MSFPLLDGVARDVEAGRPVAVAVVVEHPDLARVGRRLVVRPAEVTDVSSVDGTLGGATADAAVTGDVRGLLAAGRHQTLTYGPEGERHGQGMRIFVSVCAPPPRMLVFGAICDAHPVFATASRFPAADEIVVQWPHKYLQSESEAGLVDARTVLCVLTHDAKFDVPLLEVALRLPQVGYVGAMGSRRTHHDRLARLREAGLLEGELARLRSPIGLDLGGAYTGGNRSQHRCRDHCPPLGR